MAAKRKVFFSYASANTEICRIIVEELRKANIEVYFSEDQYVFGNIYEMMPVAIAASPIFCGGAFARSLRVGICSRGNSLGLGLLCA